MVKGKKKPGYVAVSSKDKLDSQQKFSGEVFDKPLTFPKGLGAEHPFEFKDAEKLYKRYGVIAAIINKWTDAIVTDFLIKLKNPNAQALIDSFVADTNFHLVIREWVREALLKGNGFIELDLKNSKIRVLNANCMYVKRDKFGKVKEYNQYTGKLNKFLRRRSLKLGDLISFKPNKIAHLQINKIPNDPYGIGIVWPNERVIENIIKSEQDLTELMSRKAGAPYHVIVGKPGDNVPTSVVDSVKTNLEYLNNSHNWVTDGDVEIKAINMGPLGQALEKNLMYNFRMLLAGTEMPEVKMGSGQLNEGIAKEQGKTFNQKRTSLQHQVGAIIEEKIIRPLLRANGLDKDPEADSKAVARDEKPVFIWDLPGDEEKNERILRIKELLDNRVTLSAEIRARLEIELAQLMDFEELEKILPSPEQVQKEEEEFQKQLDKENKEREEEEAIPQPETPGAKRTANEIIKDLKLMKEKRENDMDVKTWINLKEIAGFNYLDYQTKILKVLQKEGFDDLAAITKSDVANGLLPKREIDKLRVVLKEGFRENQTIKQIEENIRLNVKLTDRLKDGKVVASAVTRPNTIARTETVRVANKGLINLFKENKIEKVRFLAALSDRTCPECESLNGQVFEINNVTQPPIHVSCRCSLISVVE